MTRELVDRVQAPCGHSHPIEWSPGWGSRVGLLIALGRVRCRSTLVYVYRRVR